MTTELIQESKLYELILQDKRHKEERRDAINSYYILLFTGIMGILPFITDMVKITNNINKIYAIKLASIFIELIGLMLSIVWILSLKRILFYLEALDERIENLEKVNNISYITYIKQQSQKKQIPDRVTKYQLLLPYIFIIMFLITLVYSVSEVINILLN